MPTSPEPLIIAVGGSGRHARVVLEAADLAGLAVRGVLTDALPAGEAFFGSHRVLGGLDRLHDRSLLQGCQVHLGAGDPDVRRAMAETVLARDGQLGTIIHPAGIISPSAVIGAGTFVAAGAIVGVGAVLAEACLVNTGASIDHDCRLDFGVCVGPGARLAGAVRCGADAYIGLNAGIRQDLRIGRGAIVGAGAVVTRDVPAGQTVIGCPARPLVR
ncbi:NeuD/PglB/VioB family sugar acetyltransferase [Methylobacterium currus]|uniref:NeuD/PglB/VioB family sugar acetyltransferase n=1 Tax=Methylobacterium currus TaxID=2051553 RepID=UPI001E4B7A42|nr:NeuD/PglB/VioB family sugar acetyltransferase [Methylobacterium currus]UHC15187.1 NeuD/PglB/VioB family sugar acetyltransferase [Methylobacterium currus]